MKLCHYRPGRLGWVDDGTVRDVTAVLELLPELRWPLPDGDPLWARLDVLREPLQSSAGLSAPMPIDSVKLLAPVSRPGKILAVRRNYGPAGSSYPDVFLKAPSAVVGPGEGITLRHPDRACECEIEVAVVVGRRAARLSVAQALECVAGYCIALDLAIRGEEDRGLRKSPDSFCVLGPWVTTTDEIRDPGELRVELSISGVVSQHGRCSDQPFSLAQIVAYVSGFLTLQPGDVILAGALSGAVPVHDGDVLGCSVERLGRMQVSVTMAGGAPGNQGARRRPA